MKATSDHQPRVHQSLKKVHEIFLLLVASLLCLPFAIGATAKPWDQTDWKQWTAKDVQNVLYNSPWAQNCCRGGAPRGIAGLGETAAIVSSLVLRQALVRRMELDQHYDVLDFARRQELDRTAVACLNQKFDDRIVVILSFDAESGLEGMKKLMTEYHLPEYQAAPAYLITSDGRRVFPLPVRSGDSVEETCGVHKYLDLTNSSEGPRLSYWALYGPRHEISFPRFADGQPTIRPGDKVLRIKLGGLFAMANFNIKPEVDFKLNQMIYQGKPDF